MKSNLRWPFNPSKQAPEHTKQTRRFDEGWEKNTAVKEKVEIDEGHLIAHLF